MGWWNSLEEKQKTKENLIYLYHTHTMLHSGSLNGFCMILISEWPPMLRYGLINLDYERKMRAIKYNVKRGADLHTNVLHALPFDRTF